jgi:putative flippase GtrA
MKLREGFFFGCVGGLASLVNLIVVIIFVHEGWASPLWANFIAFCIAYQVSFLGHHYLTFRHQSTSLLQSWFKFLFVALGGFVLTESLYAFFLKGLHVQYIVALIVVFMIVPVVTFLLSKKWAFK